MSNSSRSIRPRQYFIRLSTFFVAEIISLESDVSKYSNVVGHAFLKVEKGLKKATFFGKL